MAKSIASQKNLNEIKEFLSRQEGFLEYSFNNYHYAVQKDTEYLI